MRHIISILIENEPGALSRVVDLFSARAYNIETLTVAPTEDASLSRMTISTIGSDDHETPESTGRCGQGGRLD
jgi:acetolactate synthase-1/3 small subunit